MDFCNLLRCEKVQFILSYRISVLLVLYQECGNFSIHSTYGREEFDGLVGYGKRTNLIFLNGKQNHKDWILLLEFELLSYGTELCGGDLIFKKKLAAIQTLLVLLGSPEVSMCFAMDR